MFRQRFMFVLVLLVATAGVLHNPCQGADDAKPATESKVQTKSFLYKQEPRRRLTMYLPDDWQPADKRAALVIFRCNIPEQREYFRQRGMVVVEPVLAGVNSGKLPDLSLDEISKLPKPRNQVEDTKSAIRYLRSQADKLGIDPDKIVATGTSGGGDLALQSFLNRSFEDPQDDKSVSPFPNALVLYCPAFDGINIWYVKNKTLLEQTKQQAPSFLKHLTRFVENTTDEYAMPRDHRARLIELAATVGQEQKIDAAEVEKFQEVLKLFNERDWQLLHPVQDALRMSASRILTKESLPPTLIMFGDRDHLYEHQVAFVENAKAQGQEFKLKIFKGGGHSFMMMPAFMEPSTREVDTFLTELKILPAQ